MSVNVALGAFSTGVDGSLAEWTDIESGIIDDHGEVLLRSQEVEWDDPDDGGDDEDWEDDDWDEDDEDLEDDDDT